MQLNIDIDGGLRECDDEAEGRVTALQTGRRDSTVFVGSPSFIALSVRR